MTALEEFFAPAQLCGIIGFLAFSIGTFITINKKKPSLLKPAAIQTPGFDGETTYNWNMILMIIGACVAVGVGISILANVVIFVIFEVWNFEPRSIIVLAVAFGIAVFKEYDRFVTKLLR